MSQDLILAIALPVTLFCIMFSMGSQLTPAHFSVLLKSPKSVLVGAISQMILLPLLAWLLLAVFSLPAEIFAGFIILSLAPGGTTSNMFAWMAGGNLALSIALTAIISLLTPFTIPLLAGWMLSDQIASGSLHLPFAITVLKLSVVTLLPVILGMLLRHFKSQFCNRHQVVMTRIPLIMLLLVISGIIFQQWEKMPGFIALTGLPALLLASLAIVVGYLFARSLQLNDKDARTIAIETSIQNGGTAILVTGTILHNPTMTIAPVMYGILMLLPMFAYLALLKQRNRGTMK
jgi:BASS family bile acid:Na+ symporter